MFYKKLCVSIAQGHDSGGVGGDSSAWSQGKV